MNLKEALALKRKRIRPTSILKYISYFSIGVSVGALLFIVLFVIVKGLPHISWHFIFGKHSYFDMTISGVLVTTLKIVVVTLLIATPIGVLCAVYLSEYTKTGSKLVKVIRVAVDTLSGVPSIVFGLFGMLIFVEGFGWGKGLWAGSVTLALMVLPTIISTVEESIRAVPISYREGAKALGASRLKTTFGVVVPCSMSGILSAVILSIGRVVSESACVMFTAGNSYNMATFAGEGATLAVAMYLQASEGFTDSAYAIGVVLIVLVAGLNLLATFISGRIKRKQGI